MNARTYWQKLRAIGWLKYLPEEGHAELRDQLEANLARKNAWDAHMALAHSAFEGKDESAEDVLIALAECSHGLFTPKDIVENSTKFSFKHGDTTYAEAIPDSGDWIGTEVIELANQALADSNIAQRFFVLPDTADFICVVFVPPDIYLKAQKENLIPSKYRIDVCLVDRAEATKVASLKKIPKRVPTVYVWDMSMDLLFELLKMMSGKTRVTIRPLLTDPSLRKTVFQLPDDLVDGMVSLSKEKISEIAARWRDTAGLDQSYFDDLFLDLFWDRIHRVSEAAQATAEKTKTLLVFLKSL